MEKHGKRETEAAAAPQKTVRVTDEAGGEYEATYPKRARGLVKHGRARFTDESQTAIILTCPPDQNMILEDNTMNEQINNIENTEATAVETAANEKYTYEYALKQIELITGQMDHIQNAISALAHLHNEATPTGGSARFVADGIADVVKCRETTAQKLIDFYAKMYEDLKPRTTVQQTDRAEFMNWVRDCIAASEPGIDLPDFASLWKTFN